MDQTVVLTARAGHALLLDVSRLESRHIPLRLSDHDLALMVVDTRVSHRLSDGGYGARRRECEAAAVVLGLPTLREADMASVDDPALPDRLRARVRHVVTENARVLEVARLLEEGADPRLVGPHLTASHASMRDDFEITVPEVDAAVAAALGAGAYGARMTGGGFGGCVIALLERAALGSVGRAVATAFQPEGWVPPVVFEAEASAGATRVEL
jgi:galactokinase